MERFAGFIIVFTLACSLAGNAYADSARLRYSGNGHGYQRFDTRMTWHAAEAYCENRGGYLATIGSSGEDAFVFNSFGAAWLGATDEAGEGNWRWVTGEPWGYTHWYGSEPNNCCPPEICGGSECTPEHHLTYCSTGPCAGHWNDVPNDPQSFVCEFEPSPYAFSMDRFQVVGNLPGDLVDEFDDGIVDPWEIYDPTVVESGDVVTFRSPGTVEEIVGDGFYVMQEMSVMGSGYPSPFNVENGAGDFTGVSRWVPVVPAENQWYEMRIGYEVQQMPHVGIGIDLAVANWGTVIADFFGIPPGLGISFFGPMDTPRVDWVWQHRPISEGDITGDILLRLNFDDAMDQFTADFSLDGGATFEDPFVPIGWGRETPGHYEWYFSGQSILEAQVNPEPSALLLLGSGLAAVAGFGRKRLFKTA